MAARFETISFLSDFGTTDEFVGVVKSVIRSLAPEVTVLDITHEVPPYDVRTGSLTLARSVPYLCPGVVLAVVDPGVGTSRRAVAIEVGGGQSYLIGPDNGLLAAAVGLVGGATDAVELSNPEYHLAAPGATFAGRDIFGPAAAHLCNGVALHDLGEQVDPHSLTPGVIPLSRDEDGTIIGQVFWVDRYGNCQLNIDPEQVADWGDRVQLRWTQPRPGVRAARRAHAFGDLTDGEVGLVTDSYGLLTVAVPRGSAADVLGLTTGDEVVLVPLEGNEPEGPESISTPVTLGRKS